MSDSKNTEDVEVTTEDSDFEGHRRRSGVGANEDIESTTDDSDFEGHRRRSNI